MWAAPKQRGREICGHIWAIPGLSSPHSVMLFCSCCIVPLHTCTWLMLPLSLIMVHNGAFVGELGCYAWGRLGTCWHCVYPLISRPLWFTRPYLPLILNPHPIPLYPNHIFCSNRYSLVPHHMHTFLLPMPFSPTSYPLVLTIPYSPPVPSIPHPMCPYPSNAYLILHPIPSNVYPPHTLYKTLPL